MKVDDGARLSGRLRPPRRDAEVRSHGHKPAVANCLATSRWDRSGPGYHGYNDSSDSFLRTSALPRRSILTRPNVSEPSLPSNVGQLRSCADLHGVHRTQIKKITWIETRPLAMANFNSPRRVN